MKETKLIFLVLFLVFAAGSAATSANSADSLTERLRRFDISCRMFDERFGKKTCGVEHSETFTRLIGLADKKGTLAFVEEEQKKSKERLKGLEAIASSAPPADMEKADEYAGLVVKADGGDIGAVEELRAQGPAAIPAILNYRDEPDALPSQQLQSLLAKLEADAEADIASGSPLLDAATLDAIIGREQNYGAILKRAVIALEGTHRDFPHWLPLVYSYGIGFIPFFIGIVASIIYYRGLRARVLALIMFCYFFYIALHGFFQLFAPWL